MSLQRQSLSTALVAVAAFASASPALAQPKTSDCRAFAFPVYFADDAATLTSAAERVIGAVGPRMAGCRVETVQVSIRADGRREALNERRARVVSAALVAAGAPARAVQIQPRRSPFSLFQRRVTVSVKQHP